MRPLISYDDITAPQSATDQQPNPPAPQPPAKKRKTQNQQRQEGGGKPVQHWDDPGTGTQPSQTLYDDVPQAVVAAAPSMTGKTSTEYEQVEEGEYPEEEQESRELNHEEIWDDSALVDAWNSAAAEYEAFHGPGKKWKEEPVKKSPLWYNVPPASTSKSKSKSKAAVSQAFSTPNSTAGHEDDRVAKDLADSTPLNFDTFVPTHDPSLASDALSRAYASHVLNAPAAASIDNGSATAMVSQDEAFSQAMTAMYWSGYWTAVYHCRRNEAISQNRAEGDADEAGPEHDGIEGDEDAEDEEMLPAQR